MVNIQESELVRVKGTQRQTHVDWEKERVGLGSVEVEAKAVVRAAWEESEADWVDWGATAAQEGRGLGMVAGVPVMAARAWARAVAGLETCRGFVVVCQVL